MTFKPISGFPNYELNESGEVRNINTQCILKPRYKGGYLYVNLSKEGVVKTFTVHKLVMLTFVGEPPAGMMIRHLDGNPSNPHLSNLCYGTCAQNKEDRKGHDTWGWKLTERQARVIIGLYKCGFTHKRLTEIFSVSFSTIGRITDGTSWAHLH